MALPGTKPVEDRSEVRRRNAAEPGTEWAEVPDVPFDGPPLGDRPVDSASSEGRPIGVMATAWPDATLRWWEAVRTMPHGKLWTRAEWETARGAAETHARFVEGWRGCASGAELRQREKMLGMTRDARRDLRIRYVKAADPNAPLPANVTRGNFGEL
jgi:hypothetical protein